VKVALTLLIETFYFQDYKLVLQSFLYYEFFNFMFY